MLEIIFGISTLASLWAYAGGDSVLMWNRFFALSIILAILVFPYLHFQKRFYIFKFHRAHLVYGVLSAIALFIPLAIITYLIKSTAFDSILPWASENLAQYVPPSLFPVLIAAFILAPIKEVLYRGTFQPMWGVNNVALMDALTVGIGMQNIFAFLGTYLMGLFWALLTRKFGLWTAIISHMTLAFLFLTFLFIAH